VKIVNETKLILLCCNLDINHSLGKEIESSLKTSPDWKKIKKLAFNHKITPILYFNLKKLNREDLIPAQILQEMRKFYLNNLYKNTLIEKGMIDLLAKAQAQGIEPIVLKGFAFLLTLYPDPALRVMIDVDILIKKDNLLKVRDIFQQLSYQSGEHSSYVYHTNFFKITSNQKYLNVDVHWGLLAARPYKLQLPYIWQRAQRINLRGQKVACLSTEDAFLVASLHIRKHLRELSLNYIIDIAELLKKRQGNFDWLYTEEMASKNHFLSAVYFSLYLAKELFGVNTDSSLSRPWCLGRIKRKIIAILINKNNFFALTKGKAVLLRILLFDSCTDIFIYIGRVLLWEKFITRNILKTHKTLPRHG